MKKVYARFTGDIITQKDVRLLRAECVCVLECVCVFQCICIYTLLCKNERAMESDIDRMGNLT